MARSVRSNPLATRTNRLKLVTGKRVYVTIGEGLALGYRRPGKGNGTWQARLWTGERYIKHVLGEADDYMDADGSHVTTFFQAQEKARLFAQEARSPTSPTVTRPITVGEAVDHYMHWFRENRKSVNETEACINAHILPQFRDKLVSELRSGEIKAWLHALAAKPARRRSRKGSQPAYRAAPKTEDEKRSRKASANRIFTILKAILNKAFEDGMVSSDTEWRRVKPFEKADEPLTRFLTTAEAERLINAASPSFRLLVKGSLFTGARYGELARLHVEHVNLDTGLVYITPSKSGKGRYVPLSHEGLDFFTTAIAGKLRRDLVFTREDGQGWGKNHHTRHMKAACAAAKIDPAISFHELRHTYASLLAQAGADLLTISRLLGHADTRVTSRHYAHLCDNTLKNAVTTLLPSFGHAPDKTIKAIR